MADETGDRKPKINYAGNSQKANQDEPERVPRVAQVTSGTAKLQKKSVGKKIAETFAGEDARSVGSYIIFDVVIPATKNLITDMVSQGIERLLFGDARGRSRISSRGSGTTNYTAYSRSYTGATRSDLDRPGSSRAMSDRGRKTHDFAEVVISNRGEAEQVLDTLNEAIDTYGVATVTDLYDLVGITGNYVDDKWGWDDLRGASVRNTREGYLLDLPRAMPID